MVSSSAMDLGRPDRSLCDDYMFECRFGLACVRPNAGKNMPVVALFSQYLKTSQKDNKCSVSSSSGCIPDDDDDENACVAEEIDAINDETFGDDMQDSINSELEDYAAQTACLRLDDAPWDAPGCSKAPAPDASNVPLPDFDIFGNSFTSFGTESMAKLDSLWSHQSNNLYDIWGEQKVASSSAGANANLVQPVKNEVTSAHVNNLPTVYSMADEVPRNFSMFTTSVPFPQSHPAPLPPMPRASTLEDLERQHIRNAALVNTCTINNVKPAAVNATDLERRFIEEASVTPAIARNHMQPYVMPQSPYPPMPSPQSQAPARVAPNVLPNFGSVPPPLPLPPFLPPMNPMMLPLVPIWLEHLAGRTPCLPPGCPPVPPLLRMVFDTVKDPMLVMEMLRAAPLSAPVPPPFPFPTQNYDRRTPWQRKAPGMPSGRTIEDLAFDQFAGYMSCKEREWLVKIQILQCQGTGVPYDDDYYYTMWREKQIALGWKPKQVNTPRDSAPDKSKDHEQRRRRINGSRYDSTSQPKEVVPLNVKFKGALGLPSKSSTNNPRHLISVEHSIENAEDDAIQRAGKQRKLRTLLLRLESALTLLIECQDRRVRMRNLGQNSDALLSEISDRVDTVYRELIAEDLVKILQLGKGRSVVARTIGVGCPKDVIRIVMALFSVMSLCPKKCLDDINSDLIFPLFNGLMTLSREQLMTLTSTLFISTIQENLLSKNIFCRDALVTLLFACAKRKAVSQTIVRWLCGPPEEINFIDGWSSSLSRWRELLPHISDADVQMLADWLLLLCSDTHFNSLAKLLANSLIACK